MLSLLLLLLSPATSAIVMPQNAISITPHFKVHQTLRDKTLTVYLEKMFPGHFCYGFGLDMSKGDMFCVEFDDSNSMVFSDCYLVGYKRPKCTKPSKLWLLKDSETLAGGTRVLVTRDISSQPHIPINEDSNKMEYSYSDIKKIEAHKGPNKAYGALDVGIVKETQLLGAPLPLPDAQPVQAVPLIATPPPIQASSSPQNSTVLLGAPSTGEKFPEALLLNGTSLNQVIDQARASQTALNTAKTPLAVQMVSNDPASMKAFAQCKFVGGVCYQIGYANGTNLAAQILVLAAGFWLALL